MHIGADRDKKWFFFLLAVIVFLAGGLAHAGPGTQIKVSVGPGLDYLEGRAVIEVEEKDAKDGRVLLWLYPNRFSRPPDNLNAMNRYWIYPYDFNPGWMKIKSVRSRGVELPAESIKAAGLPPGHPLEKIESAAVWITLPDDGLARVNEDGKEGGAPACEIEIAYTVRIPRRFGLFGRTFGGFTLATGWYPQLAARAEDGEVDFYAPPERSDFNVTLEADGDLHVLVDVHYFPPEPEKDARTVKLKAVDAAHVSLAVYRKLSLFTASCEGMSIRLLTKKKYKPPPDYTPGGEEMEGAPVNLPDIADLDTKGHALDILCAGAGLVNEAAGGDLAGKTITVLETSLRMEVAAGSESVIYMSDRIFELFPLQRFWKLHDIQLLRALFNHFYLGAFKEQGRGYALAALQADFAAAHMVHKYVIDVLGVEEYAEDILKWGSFISAIDYFIHSPMVQFREAYFNTIAEKDWMRDEPWAFMSLQPRGKLIYEKLMDIVGREKIAKMFAGLARGEGDIYELADGAAGEDMTWFFRQWSESYPSLNYRVGKVEAEDAGNGKMKVTARVYRDGDHEVKEPVVVRFVFKGGETEDKVWFDSGKEGTVQVVSAGKLVKVVVDPEGRLFEDASLTDNHPVYDNASEHPMRPPVIAGFNLLASLIEKSGALSVLFDMRRKYDVKSMARFLIDVSSFGYGLTAWLLHGVGRKLDLNRSALYIGPVVAGYYHTPEFGFTNAAGEEIGATSISAGFHLRYDTLFHIFDPDGGLSISVYALYHLNIDNERELHHSLSASGRVFFLHSFSGAHAIGLYGGVGGTFLETPEGQMQSLSDRMMLRAFEADETFGRMKIYAGVEYRHLWVHNIGMNILNLTRLEGIKGVLFLAGGTVSEKDGYDGLFSAERMYAEAGYGIVLLLTFFGAYPGVLELDVAVPVYPLAGDRSKRDDGSDRLPVGVYLSFFQTY
ncbi:MAG: hypothetical protein ABIJ56_01305 [Pseudomonadota bacterium]